jgi:hypothetical protein
VAARRAVESYGQADNTFPGTRDYKFLLQVADAVEANDSEALCVCPPARRLRRF